jgi:hypothetical protein
MYELNKKGRSKRSKNIGNKVKISRTKQGYMKKTVVNKTSGCLWLETTYNMKDSKGKVFKVVMTKKICK